MVLSAGCAPEKNWRGERDIMVMLYEIRSFLVQSWADFADRMRSTILMFQSEGRIRTHALPVGEDTYMND